MNCDQVRAMARDYVNEAAPQEWIAADLRRQAREHVAACGTCRWALAAESELTAALNHLREEQRSVGAPASVESFLMAAQARQARNRFRPVWIAIPVAAAALFAAVALRVPRAELPAVPAPVAAASIEAIPVTKLQPVEPATPRVRYASVPEEMVTDFVPLRYGKSVDPGESLQVVRIQLPREELLRLGLPVAADARSALIKADVALGEDGLVKAIRFVY